MATEVRGFQIKSGVKADSERIRKILAPNRVAAQTIEMISQRFGSSP